MKGMIWCEIVGFRFEGLNELEVLNKMRRRFLEMRVLCLQNSWPLLEGHWEMRRGKSKSWSKSDRRCKGGGKIEGGGVGQRLTCCSLRLPQSDDRMINSWRKNRKKVKVTLRRILLKTERLELRGWVNISALPRPCLSTSSV